MAPRTRLTPAPIATLSDDALYAVLAVTPVTTLARLALTNTYYRDCVSALAATPSVWERELAANEELQTAALTLSYASTETHETSKFEALRESFVQLLDKRDVRCRSARSYELWAACPLPRVPLI